MTIPDYLLIGHMTRDVLFDGSYAPGGTALYAALTARRLGRRVGVVSARAAIPPDWSADIAVAFAATMDAPIFENRYTPQGRVQLLHADSGVLTLDNVPAAWRSARIVHLAPILAETPEHLVNAFPDALLGMTPQGMMRAWNAPFPAPITYQPWDPPPHVLARIDALVLSIEDVRFDEALAHAYARYCPIVALTRGAAGATLFIYGEPHYIDACPAIERDPTGAGDVFAAALLVRLDETGDPLEAARFAACIAARSVEGVGPGAIPYREDVER
ncbi:PfkB family carbohydrate kinase [Roseiflexus castenholzii]|uniref:PfkB domain protein n=1 Tax=Roseiflexus castenholzii (strain DSM 13941 / HLO8) TaxID=383372 RepID=A7NJ58_ROSCS|nr:PfkB family carbohydrate kinase [Roseiflexus castenholzii]ABU57524.1 PfkB domain protein [Roseiflexus castenholzii DSM 13941]